MNPYRKRDEVELEQLGYGPLGQPPVWPVFAGALFVGAIVLCAVVFG